MMSMALLVHTHALSLALSASGPALAATPVTLFPATSPLIRVVGRTARKDGEPTSM